MYYNSFLSLLSQLTFQQEGKVSLNGYEVYVKSFPEKGRWELSTELYHPSDLPRHLKESFGSREQVSLDSQNTCLKRKEEAVSLVQIIPTPKKFIEYKARIKNFFDSLSVWVEG